MNGVPMNVPKNVLWFEVLLYLSLTLDALSVAFQDRTPSPEMTLCAMIACSEFAGVSERSSNATDSASRISDA